MHMHDAAAGACPRHCGTAITACSLYFVLHFALEWLPSSVVAKEMTVISKNGMYVVAATVHHADDLPQNGWIVLYLCRTGDSLIFYATPLCQVRHCQANSNPRRGPWCTLKLLFGHADTQASIERPC